MLSGCRDRVSKLLTSETNVLETNVWASADVRYLFQVVGTTARMQDETLEACPSVLELSEWR